MLKSLLIFSLFFVNNNAFSTQTNDFKQFKLILGKLESINNDKAIGDNGKAIGRYQIWKDCYKDAKQFNPTEVNFPYESLTNKTNSEIVLTNYLKRYCPIAYKNNDWETMARTWNGGPNGRNKQSTIKYWKKFQNIRLTMSK